MFLFPMKVNGSEARVLCNRHNSVDMFGDAIVLYAKSLSRTLNIRHYVGWTFVRIFARATILTRRVKSL